jgi:peptide/nickel transport system ATP-binding protein
VSSNGRVRLLEVSELTRIFGRGPQAVTAVDHVSFSVAEGEVVALVGESGSGKSTLARLLLRLLEPTSGTFSLKGVDVTSRGGRRLKAYWREVQAVFQDPFSSFNQFFTTRRLLDSSAKVLQRPLPAGERRRRLEEAMQYVGLSVGILDKRPHQLSGGERQRVMLARALMLRPRLLIADEPTSMLDASVRANILNLLGDIRVRYGMSVLFITHDLGQAAYIGDRLLVMHAGRLVEQGETDQVLWDPQHEYTRRLLADVPSLHTRPTSNTGR